MLQVIIYSPSIDVEKAIENICGASKEERDALLQAFQRDRTLHIMACGMFGTGKSTLLNGICGEEKFQVGAAFREEMHITKHTIQVNSSKLILTEVSGFQGSQGEDEYLENIRRECADVDVLFYCVSVNASTIQLNNDLISLSQC